MNPIFVLQLIIDICGTSDINKIAELLDIEILKVPIQNHNKFFKGYYSCYCGLKTIELADNLSEIEEEFYLGHELIHAIFHPFENIPIVNNWKPNKTKEEKNFDKFESQADFLSLFIMLNYNNFELENLSWDDFYDNWFWDNFRKTEYIGRKIGEFERAMNYLNESYYYLPQYENFKYEDRLPQLSGCDFGWVFLKLNEKINNGKIILKNMYFEIIHKDEQDYAIYEKFA
jgi:hypothetical protein